jgi:asparagine synthase (glutamine-hydrolysing)
MVLTGEGGDELFAGYARYEGERFAPYFRPIPQPLKDLAQTVGARLPGLRRPKIALYALTRPDEVTRLTNWFPLFNYDMKVNLLSAQVKRALGDVSSNAVFADHLARTDAIHPLSRLAYVDTKLWLPDDLLARGDKMSMANSLEGRVPLLDHELVEFVASLPPNLKLNGGTRKYLLKKVSAKLIPDEIITRKKQGFPVPVSVWFRGEALTYMRDILSRDAIHRRGLFDADYVEKLVQEHTNGFADHSLLLWGLVNVEVWHRLFIDA